MAMPGVLLVRLIPAAAHTPLLPESETLVDMGIRIGLAIVFGFLAQRLFFLVVGRIERWVVRAGRASDHARQRAKTIGQILRNLVTVLVGASVVLYALGEMGWDVRPLLAGAGILGVALGFGAQTLVRDVIAGVFMIAEDQFAVGDLIDVDGKPATVEAITVRCTTLRDFNGFVHFVPNGEMKTVTNRSRGWNRLAVDIPVAHGEDLDVALDVCRRIVREMNEQPEWKERLLDPIELWGVEALSSQDSQIRIVVRAKPGPDAPEAARELRRRVHDALAKAEIRTGMSREIAISTIVPGAPSAVHAPLGEPEPRPAAGMR